MTDDNIKPIKGTWANLGNDNKISFDVNVPQTVTFLTDEPIEVQSKIDENEVYYRFPVYFNDKESKIDTSAWTLLIELKKLVPLTGKNVQITKRLEKGKQKFVVTEIK